MVCFTGSGNICGHARCRWHHEAAVARDVDSVRVRLRVHVADLLRVEVAYADPEALRARGIPFIFATGYGRQSLREPYEDAPMLSKPFQQSEVEQVFVDVLGAARR